MINRARRSARSVAILVERLIQDAARLGVALSEEDAARLFTLLQELSTWNKGYNLTGITTPAAMVTHHLLDSLAIHPDLYGARIADVGTGAGFPGLPLALCNPERQFTLIDSKAKNNEVMVWKYGDCGQLVTIMLVAFAFITCMVVLHLEAEVLMILYRRPVRYPGGQLRMGDIWISAQ